jgi:hypothetical protein
VRSQWGIRLLMALPLAVAPLLSAGAQVPQMPSAPQVPQVPQIPQVPGNLSIAAPAAPVITSPKGGDSVHSPIVVRGTAAKGAKVRVTATLAMAVSVPVSTASTKIGNAEATVDNSGHWQVSIPYKMPMSMSGTKIILEAVTVNSVTGKASSATKVEVTPKM